MIREPNLGNSRKTFEEQVRSYAVTEKAATNDIIIWSRSGFRQLRSAEAVVGPRREEDAGMSGKKRKSEVR
jgi:hypothetical protein